jgi:hypothetical protein
LPAEPRATVVTGIVRSTGGLTGWPKAGDGPSLVLILTPWLRGDQTKLLDDLLRVQIPVAKVEIDCAAQAFGSGATVQLELEELEGPARGRWSGRGRLPVCRVEPNSALEAFRQLIERPTTIEDPRLGRLTLKPERTNRSATTFNLGLFAGSLRSLTSAAASTPLNFIRTPLNFIRTPLNFIRTPLNFIRMPLNFIRTPLNFIRMPLNFKATKMKFNGARMRMNNGAFNRGRRGPCRERPRMNGVDARPPLTRSGSASMA